MLIQYNAYNTKDQHPHICVKVKKQMQEYRCSEGQIIVPRLRETRHRRENMLISLLKVKLRA